MLVLSRQKLPILNRSNYADAKGLHKGAYILNPDVTEPEAIVIATGSEVQHAVAAAEKMNADGGKVRVVSMPCWELFEAQSGEYIDEVLPPSITKRVVIEAGSRFGWERYVGRGGTFVTVDTFGASAPGGTMMEEYGITAQSVIKALEG